MIRAHMILVKFFEDPGSISSLSFVKRLKCQCDLFAAVADIQYFGFGDLSCICGVLWRIPEYIIIGDTGDIVASAIHIRVCDIINIPCQSQLSVSQRIIDRLTVECA